MHVPPDDEFVTLELDAVPAGLRRPMGLTR